MAVHVLPDPAKAALARHRMTEQQDLLNRGIELRDRLAGGPPNENDGWRSARFWRVLLTERALPYPWRPTLDQGVLKMGDAPVQVTIHSGSLLPAELVLASLVLPDPPEELLAYAAVVMATGAVSVSREPSP